MLAFTQSSGTTCAPGQCLCRRRLPTLAKSIHEHRRPGQARIACAIVPLMPYVLGIALGLAAITGVWSSVAAAKTVIPDDPFPGAAPSKPVSETRYPVVPSLLLLITTHP